jgi:hypothetical protein
MEQYLRHVWEIFVARLHGPLSFRFVLQPLVVAIIACRAGSRDARTESPAYGWAVLANSVRRKELLLHGWREVAKVFIAAIVVDIVYELIVFRRIYPIRPLIVATLIALVPYPFIRGLTNRIVRKWRRCHKRPGGLQTGTSAERIVQ